MPVTRLETDSLVVCCVVSAGDDPPDGDAGRILAAYDVHRGAADLWAAALAGTAAIAWDPVAAAPAFRPPTASESRRLAEELAKVRARHPIA